MEDNILNSAMLSALVVEAPSLSVFFLFNLILTLSTVVFCGVRFFRSHYILTRLSFWFVVFFCVLYQVPLVLFSAQVEASLQRPWAYAAVVNLGAVLLMLWGVLTRRLDINLDAMAQPARPFRIYFATLVLGVACLTTYLSGVPWNCTGLFALIYDPWLTLLARELGVKLVGSSFATYSLGAYANAVVPILVLMSVWLIRDSLLRRRMLGAAVGVLGGIFAITTALVSGTKGLLMPSMVMLVAGCYFWCRTWPSRIVTITFAVTFVFSILVSFELLKERGAVVGGAYDFAACSVEVGACEQSRELLQSLTARDHSLGLPSAYVKPLQARLESLCSGEGDPASNNAFSNNGFSNNAFRVSKAQTEGQERSMTFVSALFNRMLVVPFQVSIWNFMYGETEQFNSFKALPFARRVLGESLNMPELVYQKYGSVYSGGDKTSTSTAPTSFFIAYPAYLGVSGFLLALALVIALDLFLAKFARFIGTSLVPILVGCIMVMCMNFMTSDFVTVLISHGGAAGILVLLIHALLLKRNS